MGLAQRSRGVETLDRGLIEIAVLAAIAFIVLYRLYATLGRRSGAERPPEARPQTAPASLPRMAPEAKVPASAPSGSPAGEGLMAILRADPSFDVDQFVTGARAAYEMIVQAFALGDREALRPLLTERVFTVYADAITAREAKGEKGAELVRLRAAEITHASLDGPTARVEVKFEAELAEGAHGVRDAREKWTFERAVTSPDPNWRLARVAAA